jgi:hypothetical protein
MYSALDLAAGTHQIRDLEILDYRTYGLFTLSTLPPARVNCLSCFVIHLG